MIDGKNNLLIKMQITINGASIAGDITSITYQKRISMHTHIIDEILQSDKIINWL